MTAPHIRPANREDVPKLLEIERASFSHPHWTGADFSEDECHIADLDSSAAGFIVVKTVFPGDSESPPQREILNLAVRPEFRRRGIASALLRNELSRPATWFLEVRESNLAAQALYTRFGFREVGRRLGYYQEPVETAIVMCMKWC